MNPKIHIFYIQGKFGCMSCGRIYHKKRWYLHQASTTSFYYMALSVQAFSMAPCAAARRAIGTRNGEQLT